MINQKNTDKSFFISLLSFIPIFVFMVYARIKTIITACDTAWQEPFYIGALLAITLTTFQYCYGLILDRLMLGANLFLVAASFFFLFNINPCLSLLGAYKGPSFIACVLIIGLITTFLTKPGFIGVTSTDQKKIIHASLILLGCTIAAFFWSLAFNNHGLFVSAIAPFIALRLSNEQLQKRIKGK